jgi:hypothetical protein
MLPSLLLGFEPPPGGSALPGASSPSACSAYATMSGPWLQRLFDIPTQQSHGKGREQKGAGQSSNRASPSLVLSHRSMGFRSLPDVGEILRRSLIVM